MTDAEIGQYGVTWPRKVAPVAAAPTRVVVTDDTHTIRIRIYNGRDVSAEHTLTPNECVRLAHTLLGCALWHMKE